jgi:chromosomal replication initiation ATPase DnaA
MGGPGSGWHRARAPLPPRDDVREIIHRTVAPLGGSVADILGPGKGRKVNDARNAAVRAVHEAYPRLSSSQLGVLFGRHHTTILHALGRLNRER